MEKEEIPYTLRISKRLKALIEAKAYEEQMKTPELIRKALRCYLGIEKESEDIKLPKIDEEDFKKYLEISYKIFGNVKGNITGS